MGLIDTIYHCLPLSQQKNSDKIYWWSQKHEAFSKRVDIWGRCGRTILPLGVAEPPATFARVRTVSAAPRPRPWTVWNRAADRDQEIHAAAIGMGRLVCVRELLRGLSGGPVPGSSAIGGDDCFIDVGVRLECLLDVPLLRH